MRGKIKQQIILMGIRTPVAENNGCPQAGKNQNKSKTKSTLRHLSE